LINYVRFIFNTAEGQPIYVSRDHELGKYLFSRVRSCAKNNCKKEHDPIQGTNVLLIMPSHGNDSSWANYIYFSKEDMVRINDFIESCAYLDFRMMVQTGNIDLKMNRKTVIEIYSDLIYGVDKYEMLKKDEYRKRLKIREWLQNTAKELNYR
jgi:hypothetical protein